MLTFKQYLKEKEETQSSTEEIFNSGEVQFYVRKSLFNIRPANKGEEVKVNGKTIKAKAGQYIIRNNDNINKLDIIDEEDFYSMFEPVRPNQNPDSEGFITYVNTEEIEAIKYKGEKKTIKNEWGEDMFITNNDYLIRPVDAPDTYSIMTTGEFNDIYKKK